MGSAAVAKEVGFTIDRGWTYSTITLGGADRRQEKCGETGGLRWGWAGWAGWSEESWEAPVHQSLLRSAGRGPSTGLLALFCCCCFFVPSPPKNGSDHILVRVGLPMAWLGKRAKPCYREGVSEYRLHVHPLSFFSPSSLFLFQLLYALKNERQPQLQCGPDKLGMIKYNHIVLVH